jgi:hypothetical protein
LPALGTRDRPGSLRAIDAAMQREPPFLAMFAQRAPETEHPTIGSELTKVHAAPA